MLVEKTHAETRGSEKDTGLTAWHTHKHTPKHTHITKTQPTSFMTHSTTQKQAFAAAQKKHIKNTQFNALAHIFSARTWNYASHAYERTHRHARTCVQTAHKDKKCCRGDSERRSAGTIPLSTSRTGKFSHMAKHKGPTSGNANSPLKPKPIRSLMQTCRAPLSFISPFNVRGLESDSITHPKEKREKGKRENYRGFQIIHMFSSRANWIKGEWKWLTSVSNV